jgi:NhaA family Na+:H+ antiporter
MGLALGKPIGVTLFSWLSVQLGFAKLPNKANWKHIIGLGLLAGIGFTMSIFIALLSFSNPEYQVEAKFAILVASISSGFLGYLFLSSVSRTETKKTRID